MKTTMQRYRRLLGLSLLAIGLGALNTLAGDVTADNITVNHDLTVAEPGTGSAPTDGLILYYSFSTDTTPVSDDSGNNHPGTVSGATWTTNGQSQAAYNFDGTGDYITVTGYKGILGSNPMSVSLWFKTGASLANYPVLYFWGQDTVLLSANYVLFYPDGYLHFSRVVVGADILSLGNTPNDDAWHHLVTTYDGTTSSFYIDGVLQGSHNDGALSIASNQDVRIGNYKDNSDPAHYLFNGSLDEFRIYNRALSTNEVQGLYYNDAHLTAGSARFETDVICEDGVKYLKPLGDIPMGVYTNDP